MFSIKFITILTIIAVQVFFPACDEANPALAKGQVNPNNLSQESISAGHLNDANNSDNTYQENTNHNEFLNLDAADFFIPGGVYIPPDPILPPFVGPEDDIFDDFLGIRPSYVPRGVCGDGITQPMEQCDDGNFDNLDGCNVICRLPLCGNGAIELFEQCDDNNNVDMDGCTEDCVYERCGNFRVELFNGEECDDGNLKAGDGCSPCCKFERCGNRVLDPKEECDDGNLTNGDGCSDCCQREETKEEAKPEIPSS